tara:strand:+ start:2834 stop:4108 length:1275 start_codon:yes stop_codon:yes gene_type:complete
MIKSSLSDWLEYQQGLNAIEIDLSLERVKKLFDKLDLKFPKKNIFLVAGTNGKGTTLALIESLLILKGLKTGAYTSPHLIDYNERVTVNKKKVSDRELIKSFKSIESIREDIPLTYFEFGTLSAFSLLSKYDCDALLIEVGLGGRLDATNVLDSDISIITNVDLDHQEWLGESIEEIAFEKAGIAKHNKPLIYGDNKALKVIREQADLHCSKLIVRDKDFSIIGENNYFLWKGINHTIEKIKLPNHWASGEISNLATALTALEASDEGLLPTNKELNNVLESFYLPGRFEIIESKSRWILDVAHNPGAAINFRNRLSTMKLREDNTMIISMMRDKNLEDFIDVFRNLVSNWVVCKMDTDRSFTSQELKEKLRLLGINDIKVTETPYQAFKYVENLIPISDNIIVSGSFELVGPAKEYLSKTIEI